jgi:hypothetical protein
MVAAGSRPRVAHMNVSLTRVSLSGSAPAAER